MRVYTRLLTGLMVCPQNRLKKCSLPKLNSFFVEFVHRLVCRKQENAAEQAPSYPYLPNTFQHIYLLIYIGNTHNFCMTHFLLNPIFTRVMVKIKNLLKKEIYRRL